MQTALADFIRNTPAGREADAILRSCVHCGFCNAACPTYQLLGDELDGPRGRIYLMKQMLEGQAPTQATLTHLDRCLSCRSCETTCPSGVRYGALFDIGRSLAESRVTRPWRARLARALLRAVIPHPARFAPLLRVGQFLRPLLPGPIRRSIPARQKASAWPVMRTSVHRTMLVLDGCVQPAIAPNINASAASILNVLGISLVRAANAGCCGALHHHTSDSVGALDFARRNIDAWWPYIEAGCGAVVMTASGCGMHVKDYGHLLQGDPAYAAKARRVSEMTKDLSEILAKEDLTPLRSSSRTGMKVAFQSPCTLQHGQQLNGVVEGILTNLGFALTPVPDAHLCCGSAGSYSLLQPALSWLLRERKLTALQAGQPEVIATANVGCLTHLAGRTRLPVRHWIELLAPAP